MTADVYENVDAVEKGSPNYGLGLKIIETKKKKARKMKIMEASSSSMFKRKLIYRELWVSKWKILYYFPVPNLAMMPTTMWNAFTPICV